MASLNSTNQKNNIVVTTDSYFSHLQKLNNELYFLKRTHNWTQSAIISEVYSGGWKLFIIDNPLEPVGIKSNKLYKLGRWPAAVFLPAFEVIQWHVPVGVLNWQAYLAATPLKFKSPGAIAFKWNRNWKIESVADVDNILSQVTRYDLVSRKAPTCAVARATKQFLDSNFALNLSMPGVAASLSLSYSTMTHYFRRAYCMSPSEYRQRLRVTAAGALLATGSQSATESCFETGHGDYSSFKQGFRKVLGASPRQFDWTRHPNQVNAHAKQESESHL